MYMNSTQYPTPTFLLCYNLLLQLVCLYSCEIKHIIISVSVNPYAPPCNVLYRMSDCSIRAMIYSPLYSWHGCFIRVYILISYKGYVIRLFPLQFKDPLIIMLLCSAVISLFMEQFDDAFSITMVTGLAMCVAWCMLCHCVGYHNCSHCGLHSGVQVRKIFRGSHKIGTPKVSLVSCHGY